MSDRTVGLLYVAALLLLSFVFQHQMKIYANEIAPALARSDSGLGSRATALVRVAVGWRLAFVLGLAALLFATWLLALTKLDLSLALPLASVALIVNALGTGLLLGEGIGLLRVAGVLTVAAGIAMVLRS